MFTDIHSHILHGIDDGPADFEQTKELLNRAVQTGVDKILATPHFYAERHSLTERLNIATERYIQLCEFVSQNGIPLSILKGFEVRYFEGISRIDVLSKLCINDSNVLLLELLYIPITEKIVEELLNLRYLGYNIVLAHVERYTKISGFKNLKPLISNLEVLVQCNSDSFISGNFQRSAFKLLKEGAVSFVASDMHSIERRPPNLKEAFDIIKKKFGAKTQEQLVYNSHELFANCLKLKKN